MKSASDRCRVLMLTASLGYGGSESDFLRLANELAKKMDVTLAVMSLDYGSADYSSDRIPTGLPIVVIGGQSMTGFGALLRKCFRWWRMLVRLRALKRTHDVCISFLSGPNLLNAASGMPDRTVVSERGSKLYHVGIGRLKKILWLRVLDPWIYRRSAAIVPASMAYASEIRRVGGRSISSRVIPIEGSIDADAMIESLSAVPDQDIADFCKEHTAAFCGRLDSGKGIDLIVPAFAKVKRVIPSARLLVIGDGPLKQAIQSRCESLGLKVGDRPGGECDVYLAGYRKQPVRNYRLCKVFLFPSLHEGLSNALIEAVASGVPVLAADCPWGSRSILGGSPEPHDPRGIHEPIALPFGTLMPLPSTGEGLVAWERELARSLAGKGFLRSRSECMASIARFDVRVTINEWARMIESLVQKSRAS